jgi:uncharacterized caspase-like protein
MYLQFIDWHPSGTVINFLHRNIRPNVRPLSPGDYVVSLSPNIYDYEVFISCAPEDIEWARTNLYEPLHTARKKIGGPLRVTLSRLAESGVAVPDEVANSEFFVQVLSLHTAKSEVCRTEREEFLRGDPTGNRLHLVSLEPDVSESLSGVPAAVIHETDDTNWLDQLRSSIGAVVEIGPTHLPTHGLENDLEIDIFISYAHEDEEWVREHLLTPLERCTSTDGEPIKIFFDRSRKGIGAGDHWQDRLSEAIATSRIHMPVFSRVYFEKEACEWEMKQFGVNDIAGRRLFPVLLEKAAEPQIPRGVRHIQYQSVDSPDWFERLADGLGVFSHEKELELANRHALVVGISQYLDESIPPLQFAADDAGDVAGLLVNEAGFPSENVTLLQDEKATGQAIGIGLSELAKANPDDLVFIYFAGHGSPDTHRNESGADEVTWKYLVPHDARKDHLIATGILMDDLHQRYLPRIVSKSVIIALDSCYSGGSGGRTFSATGARGNVTDTMLDNLLGDGRVVMAASGADEMAFENPTLRHGIFTHYFLSGLRGEAARDPSGKVYLDDLYEYLSAKVPVQAEKQGSRQHPVLKGEIKGRILLTDPARSGAASPEPALTSTSAASSPLVEIERAYGEGNYEAAIEAAKAVLNGPSPHKSHAYLLLGNCHFALGSQADAVEAYQEAVDLDPTLLDAHKGIMGAQLRQAHFNEAVEAVRIAMEIDPSTVGLLGGIVYKLEKEIGEQPKRPDLRFTLARIYSLQGKFGQAIEQVTRAVELAPEDELEALGSVLVEDAAFYKLREETDGLSSILPAIEDRRHTAELREEHLLEATDQVSP